MNNVSCQAISQEKGQNIESPQAIDLCWAKTKSIQLISWNLISIFCNVSYSFFAFILHVSVKTYSSHPQKYQTWEKYGTNGLSYCTLIESSLQWVSQTVNYSQKGSSDWVGSPFAEEVRLKMLLPPIPLCLSATVWLSHFSTAYTLHNWAGGSALEENLFILLWAQ